MRFECPADASVVIETSEIAEAVWLPWEAVTARASLGRQWLGPIPILAPTRRVQGYRIWGLTGAILDELASGARVGSLRRSG